MGGKKLGGKEKRDALKVLELMQLEIGEGGGDYKKRLPASRGTKKKEKKGVRVGRGTVRSSPGLHP